MKQLNYIYRDVRLCLSFNVLKCPKLRLLVTHGDRYIDISKISSFRSRILRSFTNLCSLHIHFRFCFLKRTKL